ncbi:MAG: response regulator [Isosphaeraceae bacterium]
MGGLRLGSPRILLVEDERRLRELVAQFLRSEGYDVVEAGDGGEALDRYADSGPFDLILLDLNMPVLSGVEVCRRFRQVGTLPRVMICSAAVVHEHERALHALGVTHYLTKPYHPVELLERITRELDASSEMVEAVGRGTGPR